MLIERGLLAVKYFFLNQIKYLLIRSSDVLQFGSRTILNNWMLLVLDREIWRNIQFIECDKNKWGRGGNISPKLSMVSQN
jgi:hypothetical protein